ncbi:MAG TPA: class I SAM-dependent methyltransferase [Candidatus Limnocylindria bacterium]|nr:class I SAM-dependent methyltransferase [Candidatus Limnocylindria bacterium]
MRAIRKFLQRTPWYGLYKRLGHYPDYWYWQLRGKPVRSPHLLKQRTVREYGENYGLRILIETGTYYGEMISAVKNSFERIYSIECDPSLARRAIREFARHPNIEILGGDSQDVLPELLKSIREPALFWLDAGYYGWAGLESDKRRLSAELEAILRHPVKGHVILMDDAHGLDGKNGALTLPELKSRIESEFPGHKVEVAYDILRITPPS